MNIRPQTESKLKKKNCLTGTTKKTFCRLNWCVDHLFFAVGQNFEVADRQPKTNPFKI